MVYLESIKEVYCDDAGGRKTRCEFQSLLANSQCCGNCPLLKTSEDVLDVLFEGAVNEMQEKP